MLRAAIAYYLDSVVSAAVAGGFGIGSVSVC